MKGLELSTDMRALPLAIRRTPSIKLAIHGAIYRWAAQNIAAGWVLDLGCAEGWGSNILSPSAREVIAVDWDVDLVRIACASSPRPNVHYLAGNCLTDLFRSGEFDTIVNIAMLEHVDDPDVLVAGAARWLRPDGTMLCATKNSDACLKREDGSPLYGNHANEFSQSELETLLRRYFDQVTLFHLVASDGADRFLENKSALRMERALVRLKVKELIPRQLRLRIREMITGESMSELTDLSFTVVPVVPDDMPDRAHYLLASASEPREA